MFPPILLVHDDPLQMRKIRKSMGHSADGTFLLEQVRSCADGVARLVAEKPGTPGAIAAAVVSLFLPDSRGLETLERLLAAAPRLPILIISSDEDEAVAREAVGRGAQDYLLASRLNDYSLPKMLRSMIERVAFVDRRISRFEGAKDTLDSIGDAVICVDVFRKVTYLNAEAERLIGCASKDAENRPLEDLFSLIDSVSGQELENPLPRAMEENRHVSLAKNCLLMRRDRGQVAIEDSVAPIHDHEGKVTGAVMVFRDVTAARTLALKTAYQSRHDALTDLPNRTVLEDRLVQAIAVAQRNRKQLAVFFLDLNGFKAINDTLGHAVGDRLLKSVAQRLIGCVRGSDTISRQGGDEFVVLLPEVSHAQAAAVSADKILAALHEPHLIDGHEIRADASLGIAVYPDDGTTAEALIQTADLAMYQAKSRSRVLQPPRRGPRVGRSSAAVSRM